MKWHLRPPQMVTSVLSLVGECLMGAGRELERRLSGQQSRICAEFKEVFWPPFPSASQPWFIPLTRWWRLTASSDSGLTWAMSGTLALMEGKAGKIFEITWSPYVETAVSGNNQLFCHSVSANCLAWSMLNLSVKPIDLCVTAFTILSWECRR